MKAPLIIDVHHHISDNPENWKELSAECSRLGIRKIICFGRNETTAKVMEKYPDLVVGFGMFNLGEDTVGKLDEFRHMGFRGVKFIRPLKNYDDKSFYPIYGRMEYYRLIALFHLGIVSRLDSGLERYLDTNNNRHRPIYLDTIARAFPDLTIIGAHLGNPWYEEASMAARWNKNLFFDLSGSTLKKKSSEFIGNLLWWKRDGQYSPHKQHAWEKIVFGSDVDINLIGDVLNDYRRVFQELGLSEELQHQVLYGTMFKLLGFEDDVK